MICINEDTKGWKETMHVSVKKGRNVQYRHKRRREAKKRINICINKGKVEGRELGRTESIREEKKDKIKKEGKNYMNEGGKVGIEKVPSQNSRTAFRHSSCTLRLFSVCSQCVRPRSRALDLSSVLPSSPPPPSPHQSDSFIKEIKAEQKGTLVGVFHHQFVGTET